MNAISPSIVANEVRQCRREDHENNDTENGACSVTCNDGIQTRKKMRLHGTVDSNSTRVLQPAAIGDDDSGEEVHKAQPQKEPPSLSRSPPRQWWFSRHSFPATAPLVGWDSSSNVNGKNTNANADAHSARAPNKNDSKNANANASGMVLSEHLGRTSDVVDSLTHDVKNWSLTRMPAVSTTRNPVTAKNNSSNSNNNNNSTSNFHTDFEFKKERQKRCKDAQRRVRMARRRCLEEQKRLVSSTN